MEKQPLASGVAGLLLYDEWVQILGQAFLVVGSLLGGYIDSL